MSTVSTSELSRILAGGDSFIRTKNGIVKGLAIKPKMNPDAPEVIVVGKGYRKVKSVFRFLESKVSVPVYLKQTVNSWKYLGMYSAESYRQDLATIERFRKKRDKLEVDGILFLSPDDDIEVSVSSRTHPNVETRRKIEKSTAQIANSDLHGDKLYLQRARKVLPYLVRQAKAGQTIFYSDLAQEVEIPNPRNLNYVLGAIGRALIKLSKRTQTDIPPIQCLVINKQTNFPGDGIDAFMDKKEFSKLTRSEKTEVLNRALTLIFAFQKWEWVLQQLQLAPTETDIKPQIEKAKRYGNGGESPFHLSFKNYIAANPTAIGLSSTVGNGQTEYCLPSADSIDVGRSQVSNATSSVKASFGD